MISPNESIIPYVISQGYPDFKRPRVAQSFYQGSNLNEVLDKCILDLARAIIERLPKKDWENLEQICRYHASQDSFIENSFWEAMVFTKEGWVHLYHLDPNYGEKAIKLAREL